MTEYIPPGLVSRDIIAADGEMVTVREVWDPRVKGCPWLIFDKSEWPWKTRTDVESVTHTYQHRKAEEKAK